jgi:hypothetical protein
LQSSNINLNDLSKVLGKEDVLNDMNTFLVHFLETDEDQFNQISIRLTIVELFEVFIDD